MRVSVRFVDSDRWYAYEASMPVRIGDAVEVPAAGAVKEATVVSLSSGYDGPVAEVVRVLRAAPERLSSAAPTGARP